MAVKYMIALCLLFVAIIDKTVRAESEAEAEADPYYGYYGHHQYNGYNSYYRRSPSHYGYAHRYPVHHHAYGAYNSRPVVAYKKAYAHPPPPVVKSVHVSPAPAPTPVAPHAEYNHHHHEEPQYVASIKAFPAVPEEHLHYDEQPAAPADHHVYEEHQPSAPVQVHHHIEPAPVQVHHQFVEAEPAPVQVHHQYVEAEPAPVQVHHAPAGVAGPVSTQYHAQDELGNVIYGYENINSAKQEQRDAYGNVVGSYSYDDGTGYPKYVSYIADDFGFRVTGANNLPVAPAAAPAY